MSAGAFSISKYAADSGTIHPIRIQPETAAALVGATANAAPAGAVTAGAVTARVTGGNRAYGVKARSISFKFTAAPPSGYLTNQIYRVPVLVKATYDAATVGGTGTYLGVATVIVGKNPERQR
jgi:hypothetical protein